MMIVVVKMPASGVSPLEIGATGFVPTEADTLVLEAGTGDCRRETASPSARYDHKHSGRGGHRGGDLDHQNGQDQGQGRYARSYPSSIRYSWQWMPPNDEVTLAFTLTPGASCVGSNISRFVQLTFCWLRSTRSPETFGASGGVISHLGHQLLRDPCGPPTNLIPIPEIALGDLERCSRWPSRRIRAGICRSFLQTRRGHGRRFVSITEATSTGSSSGFGGSPIGPLENSHTRARHQFLGEPFRHPHRLHPVPGGTALPRTAPS